MPPRPTLPASASLVAPSTPRSSRRTAGPRLWLVLALVLATVLPAMAPYGPWKPDELYVFGISQAMSLNGDWVVPLAAGEPFVEKPPLFMWVAALMIKLTSAWLLPEHGARLAIGVFWLITVGALAFAARRWWGRGSGRLAVLALLAALGMVQHAHMLIPDLALLAAFAVAFAGLSMLLARPVQGGLVFGTGIGMALMAKGLLGPGVLGISFLLLPLAFREWRVRAWWTALGAAALACLPWVVVWPLALGMRSTALFREWFWVNNLGRFLGFSVAELGAANESGHVLKTLAWFTFPTLLLALWALWVKRAQVLRHEAVHTTVLTAVVMLATFSVSASGRVVYFLPLLIPLAILAVPALTSLPRWIDVGLDWGARMLFSLAALACWGLWAWMLVVGVPTWPWLVGKVPLDFQLGLSVTGVVCALVLAVLWITQLRQASSSGVRGISTWAWGLALVWGTLFALLLPWLDAAKSYQATFRQVNALLPLQPNCISPRDLGDSERSLLYTITGVKVIPFQWPPNPKCEVLVWRGDVTFDPPLDPEIWKLAGKAQRPGEVVEQFLVYHRADVAAGLTKRGGLRGAWSRPSPANPSVNPSANLSAKP